MTDYLRHPLVHLTRGKQYKNKLPVGGSCAKLRIYHKDETKKKDPYFVIKCGCCDNQVKLYYGKNINLQEDHNSYLEINGVLGSIDDWREILLPLLHIETTSTELETFNGGIPDEVYEVMSAVYFRRKGITPE